MGQATRVATRAKPGTPRGPAKPLSRATGVAAPDLFCAAMMGLRDECPPECEMQLCGMQEDYTDGCCLACWENYLRWVANGRRFDPYRYERIHDGGLLG